MCRGGPRNQHLRAQKLRIQKGKTNLITLSPGDTGNTEDLHMFALVVGDVPAAVFVGCLWRWTQVQLCQQFHVTCYGAFVH